MTTIHIDGRACSSRPDINLLQACLEAGANLPYFCWHPALGSVGACRQCAVKQFSGPDDRTGRLVMACMTPVTEGALVSVEDAEAHDFRAGVVEWLMVNHPHDCPVCEEGGECHLQDMTVMTGHNMRRYRFTKRTHRSQDLGPFIGHEMNRCITCYRCVRFYRDYAGGTDLAAFASHDNVFFGRALDGPLENAFSGNLVEVCPTGVFTDKPFSAAYTRKWDLRGAPSVCVHCAVGCNIFVNAREEKVRRVMNRYNGAVNRYFLCDRGRFGHGFVNAPSRLRTPLMSRDGAPRPVSMNEAVAAFARMVASGPVLGIASPRASLENSFSLRALVGPDMFSTGQTRQAQDCVARALVLLRDHPARTPSLRDMEQADAILVLGEDVAATAPRVGLAVRQALRQPSFHMADAAKLPRWMDAAVRTLGSECPSTLFVATPAPTDLDGIAGRLFRAAPDNIARLGFAIAHRLDPDAPDVPDLPEEDARWAEDVAAVLAAAPAPLILSGSQYGSPELMEAAASIAAALARSRPDTGLSLTLPECNSVGVTMLGGMALEDAAALAETGQITTLVVLENDLTRGLSPARLARLLEAVPNIVLIDHTRTALCQDATLVLPATAFTECSGTLVSSEGRAQRHLQAVFPAAPLQAGWRWMRDVAAAVEQAGGPLPWSGMTASGVGGWTCFDDVTAALARDIPVLAKAMDAAPRADYRSPDGSRFRSTPHRASGRTAVRVHVSLRDQPPPATPDTPLSPTMEGTYGPGMPPALLPYVQAPSWNSVQALTRFQQEIGGALRDGNPGVRLLDRVPGQPWGYRYSRTVPAAFRPQPDRVLLLPETRLFGSEELSALSAPVAERIGPVVLRMAPGGFPAERVSLYLDDGAHVLPVVSLAGLPEGLALCAAHMAAPAFAFPREVHLAPASPEPMEGTA